MIEQGEDGDWKITGYTLPKKGKEFGPGELWNTFLAQSMGNTCFEDSNREVLMQYLESGTTRNETEKKRLFRSTNMMEKDVQEVYKYKPVDKKVKPVIQELPAEFRIVREIKGDLLKDMPELSPNPPEFEPTGRYTQEIKEQFDKVHKGDFLLLEERKLMHHFMMEQSHSFAWDDSERGRFCEDFFPPIDIPVMPHKPWVQKNIPIPLGLYNEVCQIIKTKLDAGVYKPSNSLYRSRWFCVIKKDGMHLRLVHSLEPLNEVTITHSGVPPVTETLAAQFAGWACGGMFDLYVGYDERTLAEKSRDLTTFQTPFRALRLVTLPMGWTNSVPIFHDDVTFILQPEIPDITVPFIDDVPIKGPKSRYMKEDGAYKVITENSGIRRFVWEHFQNLNRVVQCMKYCGGTFSGHKTVLCAEEITVVGHRCTIDGRLPEVDRVGVITRWPACTTVSEVRMFLGTIGVCRVFIKDFAKLAGLLNSLLKQNVLFSWGTEQDKSMADLKEALKDAVPLGNIDYENGGTVVLVVDTSWKAVGFYIYQLSDNDKKRKTFIKFGSITLNEHEANFSQPKRELFGLKRALEASEYLLIGCRKLVVETDAKYIHGMLNHPEMGPNGTINWWIKKILMFHFELQHVTGKTFGPDGLSRRDKQEGDETYPPDQDHGEVNGLPTLIMTEDSPLALEFDKFKDVIDSRGGYFLELAESVECFAKEIESAQCQCKAEKRVIEQYIQQGGVTTSVAQYTDQFLLPDVTKVDNLETGQYPESQRTKSGLAQDDCLPLIREWLQKPFVKPEDMELHDYRKLVRMVTHFFTDEKGHLY